MSFIGSIMATIFGEALIDELSKRYKKTFNWVIVLTLVFLFAMLSYVLFVRFI
jgi:hypothetical protein